MIDTKTYYVTAINGYRSGWMTLSQAQTHAAKLQDQMKVAGWRGKARVHYRDGTEVRETNGPHEA
jgi:hypothetical protein